MPYVPLQSGIDVGGIAGLLVELILHDGLDFGDNQQACQLRSKKHEVLQNKYHPVIRHYLLHLQWSGHLHWEDKRIT